MSEIFIVFSILVFSLLIFFQKIVGFFIEPSLKQDIDDLYIAFANVKITGKLDVELQTNIESLVSNKNKLSGKNKLLASVELFENALQGHSDFKEIKIENSKVHASKFEKLVHLKVKLKCVNWFFYKSEYASILASIYIWSANAMRAK